MNMSRVNEGKCEEVESVHQAAKHRNMKEQLKISIRFFDDREVRVYTPRKPQPRFGKKALSLLTSKSLRDAHDQI